MVLDEENQWYVCPDCGYIDFAGEAYADAKERLVKEAI
jgi:predicted RNase H-like HicB family nuclease